VDPTRVHILAVHDLLSETLALANAGGRRFGYGLALYPRPGRFDAMVFGVVTRGGESTTLTYRMLHALSDQVLWMGGRVAAEIRDARGFGPTYTTPTGLLDQPVLHLLFKLHLGPLPDDRERTMPLQATVFAGELRGAIVLLLRERPRGWPA
jgi:hypothetical protein